MKNILIIAHFSDEFLDEGNNRFNYLTYCFLEAGFRVNFITSSFSHIKKKYKSEEEVLIYGLCIKYIQEPGYSKNLSISRFISHYKMSINLKKYLCEIDIPDMIYCAIPSIAVAKVASDYSKVNKIPFIIDIQDLWPEAFNIFIRNKILNKIIFYPLTYIVNTIYRRADKIVAVSHRYLERATSVNSRANITNVTYLGANLELFNFESLSFNNPKEGPIKLIYVGTLGHNYDIRTLIESFSIVSKDERFDLDLTIIGDGPLINDYKLYANKFPIKVNFTGRLPYKLLVNYLLECDIAINPIAKGATGSIINKHADYAAAGLPVINSQECAEYRNLLNLYNSGFNCKCADPLDMSSKLLLLIENKELRLEMSRNSRLMAEALFDRKKSYRNLVKFIDS
jgi:glycosyltransferase involved in cell wall biosynthesis